MLFNPPVVRVYGQGTSWQLASLGGGESPRRVLVRGPEAFVIMVGRAFPDAEVRPEAAENDASWPDLVVEMTPSPAPPHRGWASRLFSRPPAS